MKFPLQIISPQEILFKDSVEMVIVPGTEGQLGILPRHAPLLTALEEGEIKIHTGNSIKEINIKQGFIEVSKERVLILVSPADKSLNQENLN